MRPEPKKNIGLKFRPTFHQAVKDAAWRERMSMNVYIETAVEKLMKEQGHWSGNAGVQPDPKGDEYKPSQGRG